MYKCEETKLFIIKNINSTNVYNSLRIPFLPLDTHFLSHFFLYVVYLWGGFIRYNSAFIKSVDLFFCFSALHVVPFVARSGKRSSHVLCDSTFSEATSV